jgi:hypothetical protein
VGRTEKLYGKIDTKVKAERQMINKVQNTYFPLNMNISLKEAVASNVFSKNIVWKAPYTDNKGNWAISVEYDVEPINVALSTSALDEDFLNKVNITSMSVPWSSVIRWDDGMIISPWICEFCSKVFAGRNTNSAYCSKQGDET